ncbi:minor capsid protein [Clostridium sp. SHJSY1]|uniref:minor capsid protein n=1 Tax=Clostridium sp. SHJSY1 TaxID=2942483 RepID=UPI0028747D7A|nr:minor capsid protein [Clostridium sp. SHJSY1]MDS0525467.1 minor capsid protein [Clostridium sp. SHJSY1]
MKISKEQQFFIDKSLYFAKVLYEKGDQELIKLLQAQKISRDRILQEIANIILRYEVADTNLNMPNTSIDKEYKKLGIIIQEILQKEYGAEKGNVQDLLINIGQDKYYSSSYLLGLGAGYELQKVRSKQINKIVNKAIKGKNYSDRIYDNKNDVAKQLKKELKDFLKGNTNVNEIESIIKHRFNVDASFTSRLVNNEVARVQNQVNEQFFEDHNGQNVLYSATLDDKTCEECASYDDKTFKADEDRPELPLHIGCRCCYILLPNADYRPNTRLDNNTKENIDYTSYSEWKNEKLED